VSDDFESDTEIANNVTSVNTQSSTNTNNDGDWQEEEIELSNFPFIKRNELLIPIEGKINPIDYFFMLFDGHFIKLLVDETNNYAETEFLRVGSARR